MENNIKLYKCYKGTCSKCLNEENPYITEDEYNELLDVDGKLQCPEGHLDCGIQELKPEDYPKPPLNIKKLLIIGSVLLAIVIIVGGGYSYFNHQKNKVKTVASAIEIGISEIESIKKTNEEKEVNTPIEKPVIKNEKSEGDIKANSKQKIIKTINFPFGYYKGETVNGLMHGIGTLYFTQSQIISSKDPKKRMAESGDNVNGTWYKGYLDQGKWYSKSGEIKGVINIGH